MKAPIKCMDRELFSVCPVPCPHYQTELHLHQVLSHSAIYSSNTMSCTCIKHYPTELHLCIIYRCDPCDLRPSVFVLGIMHINALHQRFTSMCMTHTVHWADPVVCPNIGLGPSPATPGVVKSIKNNSGKQRRFVEMSARLWRCSLSTASWVGLRSHPYTASYVTTFITHCLWICHSKSLRFVF